MVTESTPPLLGLVHLPNSFTPDSGGVQGAGWVLGLQHLLLLEASDLPLPSFLCPYSGSAKCPLCSVCALPVSEVLCFVHVFCVAGD